MQKNHISKILVIGIIVLFIGVGIHPAFAVDTNQSMVNKASEKDCGCNEVSATDLIRVERLLDKVEVYSKLLLVLSRDNPELREMGEELLDLVNLDPPFPIICAILLYLFIIAGILCSEIYRIANLFPEDSALYKMLYNLSMPFCNIAPKLAKIFDDLCPWEPYP